MRFLIFAVAMKLKRYWLKRKIKTNLEMLLLMLDHGAPFEEIRMFLNLNVHSLDEIYSLLFQRASVHEHEYICLKLSIKDQFLKHSVLTKIAMKNAYSLVLIGSALAMLGFYKLEFHPLMTSITQSFGQSTAPFSMQVLIVNAVLIVVVVLVALALGVGLFAWKFRPFFIVVLLRYSSLFKMIASIRIVDHYTTGFAYFGTVNMTHQVLKGLFRQHSIAFLIDALDRGMDQGNLIFQNLNPHLFDGYLNRVSAGFATIDIEKLHASYFAITLQRIDVSVKKLSRTLKLIAIILVGVAIYVFYTSLLIPLNVMEAL